MARLIFKQDHPDFPWPPTPSPDAGRMLGMQFQFQITERQSSEDIEAGQMRQLQALVRHVHAHMPHQRRQLRVAGIEADTKLTMDLWREMPLLLRQELQQNSERMRAQKLDPYHGNGTVHKTSGSTGEPVTVYKTEMTMVYWQAMLLRDALWHGYDLTANQAIIRRDPEGKSFPPNGSRQEGWGGSISQAFETAQCFLLDIRSPTLDQLSWLLKVQPAYLLSTPSNLTLIAELCLETGTKIPGLQMVRTYGEVVTDEFRALVDAAWGVRVASVYSTEEVGFIALQCPENDHYHVMSETILVEVLNDENLPCREGEIGRVVLTPLHNYAMPLFRYVIGDYAEVGGKCSCGRTLPVLKSVLGRERNQLILPNGERRYAYIGARFLGAVPSIAQYQAVQTSRERIEIRVVLHRPMTQAEEATLREMVLKALGHAFEIVVVPVESIPRAESGKYEDFKCEAV